MNTLRTTRRRSTAPLAALLLVLQGLAGVAVTLAHASEQVTAPAAIEAQHTARCPVVHDAMKCPQCQHAGAYAVERQLRALVSAPPVAEPHATASGLPRASAAEHPASRPRAPPTLLS